MEKEIRFGVMCKGEILPRWQIETIEKVLALKKVNLCLLIIEKKREPNRKRRIINKIRNFRNILWTLYDNSRKYHATKMQDYSKSVATITKIYCEVEYRGKYSQYFYDEDIRLIREENLDFILKFGFGIIRGEILETARFGVWSYHHDDEEKYRGGPPCFWEIYNGDKFTGAILQRLTDRLDGGIVLKKGHLRTIYSYRRNKDQLYFESTNWVVALCKDLQNDNIEKFDAPPSKTQASIYQIPNNRQFLFYLFKSRVLLIKKILKNYFFVDYWNIGVARVPISEFLKGEKPDVEWFPLQSKRYFIADAFGITDKNRANRLHIFAETYPYKEKKGVIQHFMYEVGVGFSTPKTIIETDTHLSYPFPIMEGNNTYILPENLAKNNIRLYKSTQFPDQWQESDILVEKYAGVDSTIFQKDGVYWLFTSNGDDGSSYKLNLFYADTLNGEWTAHSQNPVKIDIRSCRNAGTPFFYNGEWYRPAMDYSEKIEGRIILNKIVKITKTLYAEEAVSIINPYTNSKWGDKIHTLASAGEFTIVDGCKEAFIFSNLNFLKSKIATLF